MKKKEIMPVEYLSAELSALISSVFVQFEIILSNDFSRL